MLGNETEERESQEQNKSEPNADRVNEQPQDEAEECEPEVKTDIDPMWLPITATLSASTNQSVATETGSVDKPTSLPSVARLDFP